MKTMGLLIVGLLIGLSLAAVVGNGVKNKFRARLDRWERPTMSAKWSGPEGAPVVAFMGASGTQDWPLAEYFPQLRVVNAGVGYNFSGHELIRFRHDVLEQDPQVVAIKPCAINLIESGYGMLPPVDSDRVRDAMAMMVELARGRGIVPILCTPIPVGAGWLKEHGGDELKSRLDDFVQWIRDYCAENNVLIADYSAALSDEDGRLPAEITPDGLHLKRPGYDQLTDTLRPVLQKALAEAGESTADSQ